MEMKSAEVVRNAEERKAFYAKIDRDNLAPLWEVLKGLIPSEPKPTAAPHLWCQRRLCLWKQQQTTCERIRETRDRVSQDR